MPRDYKVVEGANLTLQCTVTAANPKANMTWYKVTANSNTTLSFGENLTFLNIQRSDNIIALSKMASGKLQYQELVHLKFSVSSFFQFLLLPTIRLLQHKLFIKRNCSNTKTFSLRCVQEFFFSWSPGKFNGRGQGVVTQGDIRRKA